MGTRLIGVDIGSTTVKAALVEVTPGTGARLRHVARVATPGELPAIVAAARSAVGRCTKAATGAITAVGIASMAESGAALDRRGDPLTPLLRWDRHVASAHVDAVLARRPDLPVATGVPATTKPAAVALTALRDEQPDAFRAMRHWAAVADELAFALTGERATDHTLATRTMLAVADGSAWDAETLAALGLDARVLPAVRAPGEPAGATTASARAFGLRPGIPVFVAGHDHAVGAWAAGARAPGETADSLGTAEAIVRVVDAVDVEAAIRDGFAVGRTVDAGAATLLGGSRACGAMLAWWDERHPEDRIRERLATIRSDDVAESGMLVLPYPSGRQCPAPDPAARVRVLAEAADPALRAQGLLLSLVAHGRWVRETADALAGSPSTRVTVLGSLVHRIPAWAPLIAAAGVPTSAATCEETVAAGAALLAGVRAGALSAHDAAVPRTPVAAAGGHAAADAYRRLRGAVDPAGARPPLSEGAS